MQNKYMIASHLQRICESTGANSPSLSICLDSLSSAGKHRGKRWSNVGGATEEHINPEVYAPVLAESHRNLPKLRAWLHSEYYWVFMFLPLYRDLHVDKSDTQGGRVRLNSGLVRVRVSFTKPATSPANRRAPTLPLPTLL